MKLFILSFLSVTLIAAQELEQAVPDVISDESGYRSRIPATNYKGSPGSGTYSGNDGYVERGDKEGSKYSELGGYGYDIPVQILNNREKNPIVEEEVYGYGEEKGRGGYNQEQYPFEYQDAHEGYYGHVGYKSRFPDYKYRTYGREGLGFDKRTAYALGLRYPLTPQLLQVQYRRYNLYKEDEKQNNLGKIVVA